MDYGCDWGRGVGLKQTEPSVLFCEVLIKDAANFYCMGLQLISIGQ